MALTATCILEVEIGASDSNGGAFDPSQSAGMATDLTVVSGGTSASPVVSSASNNFGAGDVGAWLFIAAGTNFTPGWYKISSVASNQATLNAAVGAAVLWQNSTPAALNAVAGCATTATPSGGTWTVDYSQQGSAAIAYTDLVIGATTTQFTSAAHPVAPNIVGNALNVTGGTGFTVQRVIVTSVSGTTATCSTSLGTAASTGGTGNLGGALLSPGIAAAAKVAGADVFIQYNASVYSITSTTANVAGGRINETTGGTGATNFSRWVGYNTTRTFYNTDATRPTIQANGAISSFTLFTIATTQWVAVRNLIIDGNAKAVTTGLSLSVANCRATNVLAKGCGADCISVAQSNCSLIGCEATTCTGGTTHGGFATSGAGCTFVACESHGNSTHGFYINAVTAVLIDCYSYANSGASSDGFANNGWLGSQFHNCAAYNNGRYGWDLSAASTYATGLYNCWVWGNSNSDQFHTSAVVDGAVLRACAGPSGSYSAANLPNVENFITLTADPTVNGASGNFALNNTSGAGAALRNTGYPSTFPAGTTANFISVGPAQLNNSSSGGTSRVFGSGVILPTRRST